MKRSVLLLAGGAGTRIRSVHPDIPKPLIPVAGQPFIEWIMRYWRRQGLDQFVVSLGHLADKAEAYFGTRVGNGVSTLREEAPLGTGGAIAFAAVRADLGDPFVAANADSLVAADLGFVHRLLENTATDGVIVAVAVPDTGRYGSLETDSRGNLARFREKRPGRGVINGGIYFLKRNLLREFPNRAPLSMEQEVFPSLIERGARIRVAEVAGDFLDIGTAEGLAKGEKFLLRNMSFFEI